MKATLGSVLAVTALAVFLAPAAPALAQHAAHAAAVDPAGGKAAATGAALRDLWVGHIFWARNVVAHSLAGNKAAAAAAEKEVVANARAIAGAIEPYYGKEASEKLFGLLAGHYGAIKEFVQSGGSKEKEDAAIRKLTTNAGEIAKFLSSANPNLPFDTLQGLLLAHGGHHLQQVRQLRSRQYVEEARTWEAMKNHMYVIADALAGAIVKQFPAKFS